MCAVYLVRFPMWPVFENIPWNVLSLWSFNCNNSLYFHKSNTFWFSLFQSVSRKIAVIFFVLIYGYFVQLCTKTPKAEVAGMSHLHVFKSEFYLEWYMYLNTTLTHQPNPLTHEYNSNYLSQTCKRLRCISSFVQKCILSWLPLVNKSILSQGEVAAMFVSLVTQ